MDACKALSAINAAILVILHVTARTVMQAPAFKEVVVDSRVDSAVVDSEEDSAVVDVRPNATHAVAMDT